MMGKKCSDRSIVTAWDMEKLNLYYKLGSREYKFRVEFFKQLEHILSKKVATIGRGR